MRTRNLIATSVALAMAGAAFAQTPSTEPRQTVPSTQAPMNRMPSTMASPSFIATQAKDQTITYEIIGLPVYGSNDEQIGSVENLILDKNHQVVGAILSVGGFLGLGSKAVAVPWESLQFETRSGKDAIFLGMSEEQLVNAPEYKTLAELRTDAEERRLQQESQRRAMEPAPTPPVR